MYMTLTFPSPSPASSPTRSNFFNLDLIVQSPTPNVFKLMKHRLSESGWLAFDWNTIFWEIIQQTDMANTKTPHFCDFDTMLSSHAGRQEVSRCRTIDESGNLLQHINEEIFPGFETQSNGTKNLKYGISSHTKRTDVLQKLKKVMQARQYDINISLNLSDSPHTVSQEIAWNT